MTDQPISFGPAETAEGEDFPLCRQLSVFLENRLGQLLRLTRFLEQCDVAILAMMVEGSVDCAIVRMIVDNPDDAAALLRQYNFSVAEHEILVVGLPHGKRGIMSMAAVLIAAEVNINYTYPFISTPRFGACMALQVDTPQQAANVLRNKNFRVFDQTDFCA